MAQARPEIQPRVRLQLGKVYLELMYYADRAKNVKMAIEYFEWVLERSKEKEELVEASNGKTQALWWDHVTGPVLFSFEDDEFPLRRWATSIATRYKDDSMAVCHYALSSIWTRRERSNDLTWFDLAWGLLQAKHQAPPPGFHYFYFLYAHSYSNFNSQKNRWQFRDLSFLMSALEHLALFVTSVTLKDVNIIQRCVTVWPLRSLLTYSICTKDCLSQTRQILANSS
jgi:hypothetical protein